LAATHNKDFFVNNNCGSSYPTTPPQICCLAKYLRSAVARFMAHRAYVQRILLHNRLRQNTETN